MISIKTFKKCIPTIDAKTALFYVVIIMLGMVMILPFFWALSTSFKPVGQAFAYPPEWIPRTWTLSNYVEAFHAIPFVRYLLNSLIVATSNTALNLLFCSMAGYTFARLKFRGRNLIFVIFLSTLMIPREATLAPLFMLCVKFGWVNTYWGLILPGAVSSFGIFLFRQFFHILPTELEDAAMIDGCGRFGIYWRIILPLSKPPLATLAVVNFMWCWNDFIWPLIVANRSDMRTIQVGLAEFQAFYVVRWTYLMAATILAILPMITVFLFLQKYLVKGIALTGLKQ